MYKYIAKRVLMMIPVVIGVSLLVFTVLKLAPGDVADRKSTRLNSSH